MSCHGDSPLQGKDIAVALVAIVLSAVVVQFRFAVFLVVTHVKTFRVRFLVSQYIYYIAQVI